MARVKDPQPGNHYKVICIDNQTPHREKKFKFLNVTRDGRFELEVDGDRRVVADFCELCRPWACEVHDI